MRYTIGLDVHTRTTAYALADETGRILKQGEIKTSPDRCMELVSWLPPGAVIIGMESSTYIYPLYDALHDAGYAVKVANPIKLKRITESAVKYDMKDARDIALQLLRNDFPESYMLSREMRDRRELVRQHMRLTQELTRVKNQIHAFLAKHNHKLPCKLGTKASITFLKSVELSTYARLTLDLMTYQLMRAGEALRQVDHTIKGLAETREDTKKLMAIDGIGVFTAATFIVELGDWRRFSSVKQVTAYVGLIPRMYGSAHKMHYGRMRCDGNHYLKYAFTRAAEQAIRKENRFQDYFNMLIRKGKGRRTAICAVANKLLRTCYGVLRAGEQEHAGSFMERG